VPEEPSAGLDGVVMPCTTTTAPPVRGLVFEIMVYAQQVK
jgi:hypothetical protein